MRALPGVLSGFSKQRAGRRRGSEQMEMKVPELNTAVFRPGSRVISACSGGADSIALLELLNRYREKLKINLTAVHVHHGLRDTADRDAAFVKEFCESRGIACIIRYVDVPARVQRTHETVEEAARILRYEALLDAAAETGADTIATAHHRDDQAETILFQMLRGSGLRGLSGMPESREIPYQNQTIRLVRPLLQADSRDLRDWLRQEGIEWCEDETNAADDASRNLIRHTVLPALIAVRPDAAEKIAETGSYLSEVDTLLREEAAAWLLQYADVSGEAVSVPAEPFAVLPKIRREYVIAACFRAAGIPMKDLGRGHIDAAAALFEKQVGRTAVLPGGACAVRTYDGIIVRKDSPEKAGKSTIYEAPAPEGYLLEIHTFPYEKGMEIPDKADVKWFDHDRICGRIVLRYRREGDLFSTLPGSHKKLKDFMIDAKIPQEMRDRIPVISDDREILWIPGYRMSENFKITDASRTVTEIKIIKESEKHE